MGKSSNKKTTFRPPSRVDALPFPVFGLTWYGSPSTSSGSSNNAATGSGGGGASSGAGGGGDGACSVIAYCGGGGSAKTGVGNKIVVLITTTNATTTTTHAENGIDDDDVGGGAPTSAAAAFDSTPRTEQRQIEISTGDALCFGVHAFCPPRDDNNGSQITGGGDNINTMVRLLACVGDEILLYGIPLTSSTSVQQQQPQQQPPQLLQQNDDGGDENKIKDEAILLGKTNVGNSYGASVASYSTLLCRTTPGKLIHCIAVGCENGTIVIFHLHPSNHHTSSSSTSTTYYEFAKVCECVGHAKAVCAISFHPRGNMHQLLTSAKDGTARIFNIDNGEEMSVMQCEVHDPKLAPPPPPASAAAPTTTTTTTTDPRMMKRPPQILVRGCAYGDLEGKVIYTVASGKRGPAYLTKWRTTALSLGSSAPSRSSSSAGNDHQQNQQQPTPPQQQAMSIAQEYRIQCSPVPISATSLSSDGTLLTLGSVEGSVLLYNLSTCTIQKEFKLVHDLPVTCVASRPIPNALYLPGELEEGVSFDAISASADNRLGRWTLQSKSRIIASSRRRTSMGRGGSSFFRKHQNPVVAFIVDYFVRIPLLLTLLLITLAIWDATDVCRSEFSVSALIAGGREGVTMAGRCFYREVLWAEESRVSFVPE